MSKEERKKRLGTYDIVDGLGEATGVGAEGARLLVRDTLGGRGRDEHEGMWRGEKDTLMKNRLPEAS